VNYDEERRNRRVGGPYVADPQLPRLYSIRPPVVNRSLFFLSPRGRELAGAGLRWVGMRALFEFRPEGMLAITAATDVFEQHPQIGFNVAVRAGQAAIIHHHVDTAVKIDHFG